jgi:hypothetical protein
MIRDLKLKIADITISITPCSQEHDWTVPISYQPFIWLGKTDIRLRLHRTDPQIQVGEAVFDSQPIWSLHRQDSTSVIRIFGNHDGLARYLIVPDHMRSADLHFVEQNGHGMDPFFGPTLELLIINYLARGKGVILHACGIELDGKGYLFAGESGAGKSTIAELWAEDDRALVLSDDRTVVRHRGDGFWMYGTPWHGEARYGSPQGVKLEGIFFLQHAKKNSLRKIASSKSVVSLLQASFPPHWDKAGMDFSMGFLHELAGGVSCRQLSFVPEKSAIEYIKEKV